MFNEPAIVALLATQWSEPDDGSGTWFRYGITEAVRLEIVRLQYERCSICLEQARLVVDHDHVTHLVRGLICGRCNTSLGAATDDVQRLRAKAARLERAAAYLEHTATRSATVGDEASWSTTKASGQVSFVRHAQATPAAAAPAPAVRCFLDVWPENELRRFPFRVVPQDGICERWTMWCTNKRVEAEAIRNDRMGGIRSYPMVSGKGVMLTADVLCMDCVSPEQSLAFYALAFARTFEASLRRHRRDDVDMDGLLQWLRDDAWSRLDGVDGNPWHYASVTVLPEEEYVRSEMIEAVTSRRSLAAILLAHWIHVASRWSILDFVDRTSASNDGEAA